ncbi:MAG: Mrp/NBP35 family ATP-binding protein [Ignavibacteria bacterium]|nr:Mrp/NBP35 family ATP-binding protein [Ignavibacteria bacterium]
MSEEKILEILSQIQDPFLKNDLVSLGFVKSFSLNGNKLSLELGSASENNEKTDSDIRNAFKIKFPETEISTITFTRGISTHINPKKTEIFPEVKNTIAISSGKGGVGKSTIAANLAASFAKKGFKTGLIDADIYGPSIPLMFGINEKPKVREVNGKSKLLPIEKYGVKIMSIGFLVDVNSAVVWRGPMASSALRQFISDVIWGELDVLFFDMPPGTGDIQLTLSQTLPLTGAVIVTTPQEISLADARKGYYMFEKVNVPTLGIIENMSYYQLPGGDREYIFGKEGGRLMASEFKTKLLGEIPINTRIRTGGDEGKPVVINNPGLMESEILSKISDELINEINIVNANRKENSDLVIEI